MILLLNAIAHMLVDAVCLATLFGAPGFLSADAPETVYSRGNLAEILKAFNDTLEQMFAAQ